MGRERPPNGTGFTRPAGLQRTVLCKAPHNKDITSECEPRLAQSGAACVGRAVNCSRFSF
jgi:hypothetical protein